MELTGQLLAPATFAVEGASDTWWMHGWVDLKLAWVLWRSGKSFCPLRSCTFIVHPVA